MHDRLALIAAHMSSANTAIKRSPITCHVLDSSSGIPGRGIVVQLDRLTASSTFQTLATGETDDDGRCSTLLQPGIQLEAGLYKMKFETGRYFEKKGGQCFYPYVEIIFNLEKPNEHYHIPLLLSPYSYTTYRGS
ncbi:uncharacterized protein VTP21DRAFT_10584 [Calcarisporiella thermophila]|uniref:uncharacterized protein n=1 Tax=Calcarisporiella thermophila TaxID=911321 RepID=UPI003744A6C8